MKHPLHVKLRRKVRKSKERGRQSEPHKQFVRGFECIIAGGDCGGRTQAAHVRNNLPPDEPGTERGMGYKPSAAWLVPMCEYHHREQHQIGEGPFCTKYGIDMVEIAQRLARMSPSLIKPRES